jgi:hypothetical protein
MRPWKEILWMVDTAVLKASSLQVAVVFLSGQILPRSSCLSLAKVMGTE